MKHKGTVKLESERLILRRFVPNDLQSMFRNCWSDFEVWRWTSYDPMNSIDDVLTPNNIFTDFWFAKYKNSNHYDWAIQSKTTNEVIGRIRGMNPNDRIQQVELAYELGKDWWNQGYASEAVRSVIDFFFNEIRFYRISANHADENPASGRVMQKSGMIYEGCSRQGFVCNAGRFNGMNYAILAEDYRKSQSAKTDDRER